MIRHIVFWKLREDVTGQARADVLKQIKDGFEATRGKIPGLRTIEIGIPFSEGAESADVALYSEFDSRAALDGYQTHPLHEAMATIVRQVRIERRVADYEV
jgi:hypothetical protein